MQRILGVSDVSLGYGSPEVAALMHDLCARYGAEGLLLEPDEPDRPPVDPAARGWGFRLQRTASTLPPQSVSWRRQHLAAALKTAEAFAPDMLILFGGPDFPLLPALTRRPPVVVYHAYEQIAGLSAEELQAHRLFMDAPDLVVTPAMRRLLHDCATLGAWPRRVVEIRNSADVAYPASVARRPAGERNGRFFWCGALDRRRTFADWFVSPELAPFNIDHYGRMGADAADILDDIRARPNIAHHGLVPADELNAARAASAFSLVWWNPANSFGHLHLASNRFFTSILAGTPPVAGPHPQCLEIARKYDCAIIMEDWTADALARAMRKAADIYPSDAYGRLVERCLDAGAAFDWPVQSAKIVSAIDDIAAGACAA